MLSPSAVSVIGSVLTLVFVIRNEKVTLSPVSGTLVGAAVLMISTAGSTLLAGVVAPFDASTGSPGAPASSISVPLTTTSSRYRSPSFAGRFSVIVHEVSVCGSSTVPIRASHVVPTRVTSRGAAPADGDT